MVKKSTTDGKWYATVNGVKKVMDVSFYNFIQNLNPGYNDPGYCMALKDQNGVFGETPWNCAMKYGPICEYNNTYKLPCAISNQGKRYFNLENCHSIATIRDKCGNVIKGACELVTPNLNTYDDAIQECRNQGMDLFTAETKEIYDSFIQYTTGLFSKHKCAQVWSPGCGLWIGGKQVNGNWFAVKDWNTITMNTQHYKFITSQNPGQCMALKNNYGFAEMAYNCNQGFSAMCEFDSRV